jgi:hypothetical protein
MGLLRSLGSFLGFGTSPPAKPPPPTQNIGTGGFAVFGGFLQSPEKNPDLVGSKRYVTYTNAIANSPVAAKGVRLYFDLVGGADWTAEPANDSKAAKAIAETVDKVIHGMTRPWRQVVRYQARYHLFDFATAVWTAKRRPDGTWGADVDPRPNHTIWRWDVDPATSEFRGVWQLSPQTFEETYLPRSRLVYSVDATLTDSPTDSVSRVTSSNRPSASSVTCSSRDRGSSQTSLARRWRAVLRRRRATGA